MRLPAPPGIGYKSSRILGLEESYLQVGGWDWLILFGIGWDLLLDWLGLVGGIGTRGVLSSGWSQHCVMSSKNTKC